MRIAIASDAWAPQTNGVVTTLRATAEQLERAGHRVRVISSAGVRTLPCPSYPEIRLAVLPGAYVGKELKAFRPHAIHIATEGPLGMAVRRFCLHRDVPFTTSYHTRYPEYVAARYPVPLAVTYAWLRRFHGAARRTFVASHTLIGELAAHGFGNLHLWRRGVDLRRFHRRMDVHPELARLPRPIMAYMGRLAVEKNLESFLKAAVPGTKLLIGDGPARAALAERYPGAVFAGYRFSDELAHMLASADVFVFPSLTDTFGLAMVEALACGLPVAAFPVAGPLDVVEQGVSGVLDNDLATAITAALKLDRRACEQRARTFTWEAATDQFLAGLEPIPVALRGTLAVSRGSILLARLAAFWQATPRS